MTENPINLERAFDALREGRWGEAEAMARDVLAAHDARRPMALHLMGLAACTRRALEEGIGWLQAAVVADPQPTFMLNLANALQERNRHEEARVLYERVVVAAPQDPLAHYNQGVLLKHLGETEAAASAFSRCLTLRPEHLGALNGLNACLVRLGRVQAAIDAGRRALVLKDRAVSQRHWVPASPRSGGQRVIAYSLFGNDPTYVQGALSNAREVPQIFPGWRCRFYVDASVPATAIRQLEALGADIVRRPLGTLFERLTWRFLVADDPTLERWLCRDCDSRPSVREALAVQEWIDSGAPFHLIRDAPTHCDLLLAGLWGGRGGVLPPMAPLLAAYRPGDHRFADQAFLGEQIWPLVRESILIHDSVFGLFSAKDFPLHAPGRETAGGHVGIGFRYGHRGVDPLAGVERPQGRDAAENAVVDRVAQFKREGRFEEGVTWLDGVIGHEDRPVYRLARSGLLLPLGRYREGFADLQSRLATYVPGSARYTEAFKLRDAGLPLWQGEPLTGRRLFVHPEQGQGDFIMCARFLQRLPALGADKVLFRAIEPMATYAQALPLVSGVEYLRTGATLADMDTHVSLMSLMHFLGIATDEDIGPPIAPRLPSHTIAEWQRRLGPQPIGVTWRGDPQMAADSLRSIPFDAFLAGVILPLRAQGHTVVSLQHDVSPAEQDALRRQGVDVTAIQTCRDWLDTTGLVASLAAVTGVCTALIHLAGSLDCPTLLLNRAPEASDWRWRWGRCDTPWYPSLRIVWQTRLGDWREPMAVAVDRLLSSGG